MMIAVVLSANIKRMARDGVLVRKPVGIEAAGSMNLLFTDKTGTLTEGKMKVAKIITADGYETECASKLYAAVRELYLASCVCNTEANMSAEGAIGSNATDRALLNSVSELTGNRGYNDFFVRDRLLFDSAKKISAVSLDGKRRICLVKGAPEKMLSNIRYAYSEKNGIIPFSRCALCSSPLPSSFSIRRSIFSIRRSV